MVSNKIIAVLAASSTLALFAATSASAELIVKEQQQDLSNTPSPDVDPGASRGPDKPIVTQERMQLGKPPGLTVPEPSMKGGELIPAEEKKDLR